MMTDGGKSLLFDIFKKNFSNQFFMNYNTSDTHIGDDIRTGELTDFSSNNMANIIKTYGCDSFAIDPVRDNLDKERLLKIYDGLTDKPYVFVYVRSEDFSQFCDYGFFIGRDPRACWVVTQHRAGGPKTYSSAYFPHWKRFLPVSQDKRVLTVKFEELISNQKKIINRVMDMTGLTLDYDKFIHSTPQYNKFFTIMDLLNMRKYSDDTNAVKDEELDYLSEVGKEFNLFFNNPDTLHLNDMIPETIYEDIENHVKDVGWTPNKG